MPPPNATRLLPTLFSHRTQSEITSISCQVTNAINTQPKLVLFSIVPVSSKPKETERRLYTEEIGLKMAEG